MSILIVEGVDGSGKTTLLRKLREQSKTYFWVASSSHRPKTIEELHEAIHFIGQAAYLKVPIICDRFPLISEAVYGPVLRGNCLLDEVSNVRLMALTDFLAEVDRIIYCRPPIEVIRQNIVTSALPQLAGVSEHLPELVKRYDTLMDSFQDQVRVYPYNYLTDASLEALFFGGRVDKLSEIFRRQAAYVRSLKPTYLHNGFGYCGNDMPWDLDGRKAQEEFRLLAWRCTEEIIESMDSWERAAPTNLFYQEEVADALHFFIELCLATGVSEDELVSGVVLRTLVADVDRLDLAFSEPTGTGKHGWYDFIRALAFVMMQFRQRPWRTDIRETDRNRLVLGMYLAFRAFVDACKRTGITAESLHAAYFKKAQINDQRRESFGCQPA